MPRSRPTRRLRPPRFDELGLRRAVGDRLLPLLVAAMAFLGALALAGAAGAAALSRHWQGGAGLSATVQVPRPLERLGDGTTRLDHTLAVLRSTPGVATVRAVPRDEVLDLLRPWLGPAGDGERALPLPGVIDLRLTDGSLDADALTARLAPVGGAQVERQGDWADRIAVLARSVQVCAALVLAVVAAVAGLVVAIATRAGLAARREAIEIVHGLGATDSYIATRFAQRTTRLALIGALLGTVLALPVLAGLAWVAAPLTVLQAGTPVLPAWAQPLTVALPAQPVVAAAIGWLTAQMTVRRWLRRLP